MSSFPAELASSTPPVPPPKGPSGDLNTSTSAYTTSSTPPPLRPLPGDGGAQGRGEGSTSPPAPATTSEDMPDPGEDWLPDFVRNKGTQDLATLLSSPSLLHALAHAPSSAHESTLSSHKTLTSCLHHNSHLAEQLTSAATRLSHQRSATQAALLSTHSLERQWRQKQADMDHALGPFAPAALYQRLGQGVQEQGAVCEALEESFLDGGGGAGRAGRAVGEMEAGGEEKELGEWVRRYREARVLWYLRRERRERWDEGRVGGWR
ncbi:hypothetical protein E4U61_000910 [Claviceps capensis]|nr:hypothetical protein E4U61_000910 [Claviceps capensis]